MNSATDEPRIAADDIGIRFLAIASRGPDYPGVEWGEIHQVCALRNQIENVPPWLEIYVDHFSGVDFRFTSAEKGYEQVMTAMEQHLSGFSRARAEAVGTWEEEQDLPVVWRRDLVAQPFESRLPQKGPRGPKHVETHAMECLRNATIAVCEMRLGRQIEAGELRCIHTDVKDGTIQANIAEPLSKTLTRRQDELHERGKPE
jgi:hypothetical protein